MEQWSDEGLVLKAQLHGEKGLILHVLTSEHGRHAGYVYGSPKKLGDLQPGAGVALEWKARIETFLGTFTTLETAKALDPSLLDCPARLAALQSVCAVLFHTLPERLPCPGVFEASQSLIESLGNTEPEVWSIALIHWEIGLLGELGYGLDLKACAVTGSTTDLEWVSPKTGRAVSRDAGAPWAEKLLRLPDFLKPHSSSGSEVGGTDSEFMGSEAIDSKRIDYSNITQDSILDGLTLTSSFLERWPFAALNKPLPECRSQLKTTLQRIFLD